MGIINVKNAVKLGKFVAKEKKDGDEQKLIDQAKTLANYTIDNFERFYKVIQVLETETKELILKFQIKSDVKLSWKEKRECSEWQNIAKKNLKYLYLAKDYFVFVDKVLNEITLKASQYSYIIEFAPFFDGIKVLDLDNDHDDTILGMFKEIKSDILGIDSSSKSAKDLFNEYVQIYHKEVTNLIIPDFDSVVTIFKNSKKITNSKVDESFGLNNLATVFNAAFNNHKEVDNSRVDKSSASAQNNVEIECPNCKHKLNSETKFCPECGTKIEVEKNKFCPECGSKLKSGAKFCSECGTKLS